MKKAFFRFYEELNDFLSSERKKVRFVHSFQYRRSVKDMIESLGVPHTEIDLILVNGQSVSFSHIVEDGDDVSVYPVFETFNCSPVTHLRKKPLRNPKFILDVHLGRLCRYLRMSGIDTAYQNDFPDPEIVRISLKERRTILTRDKGILKRNCVTHGYWIRNKNPLKQFEEVLAYFDLFDRIEKFSRCLECNGLLTPVLKEHISFLLPEKVQKHFDEFHTCKACQKIFWKGSHFSRMEKLLEKVLKSCGTFSA